MAPPGFFGWAAKWETEGLRSSGVVEELRDALTRVGYTRNIDGGIDYEFFKPVRAGDVLVTSLKVTNISERGSKTGKAVFVVLEITYINQNGDLVAKERQIAVF